jgi:hypothetical protein
LIKLNDKNKNRALRLLSVLLLCGLFFTILSKEQDKKEFLHELFKGAQAADNENQGRYFQYLRDINCSLKNVAESEKEVLYMYMKIYEESIMQMLTESYISDKTKKRLKDSLEYVPCECKGKT